MSPGVNLLGSNLKFDFLNVHKLKKLKKNIYKRQGRKMHHTVTSEWMNLWTGENIF